MRHAVLLIAIVATMFAAGPAVSGGQSPETGSIAGHVKLTTRVRGAALPSTAYPGRSVGNHEQPTIPEIRNVVVYLKEVAYGGPLPIRKAELRQKHETFVPHVIAIMRGSSVDFPNDDPIFHNVFSLSGAASSNLGRYPPRPRKAQKFTKAGIVKVFCDIHSHMSATILVLDHPYFTVPDVDGSFELANIPTGQYTIVGWHERVGERIASVRVERGRPATVTLSLPVEDPQ
jgi:plastocyanin